MPPPPQRRPRGALARALAAVDRLEHEYPVAECALVHASPWQLLVATILSAQCTDERVNQVTPALFARYPGPGELAGAEQHVVEEIIRPTGFFRSKARAIREMSQDVVQRFGGAVPEHMEELVSLRGVGRKTANVVLGVGFGHAGFAVDTHVTRLVGRLRLTTARDPVGIEREVVAMVPGDRLTGLSLRLILHGRRVCVARRPRCSECVLHDVCPSSSVSGGGCAPSRRTSSR